jgi:hypothetical protein
LTLNVKLAMRESKRWKAQRPRPKVGSYPNCKARIGAANGNDEIRRAVSSAGVPLPA